ncbi:PAS domain S-box protein [Shewanella eurypsychrophilus]|uniref:PAS domain S-box protein n=1 Tax=Shewanella eurypsychrophilus TaxID=2593656 RepID=A0ABX6VC67_9GAMM|nr:MULTISPECIES: PAS domain-containing protein [Shewanella]QFU23917.1 PAS domain S-box protein [Shewanella sp. YLB-09]QPG59135.1 PAS domain S-box protein [Shewanella eurypsychrophilus]
MTTHRTKSTQREIKLAAGDELISNTDKRGVMTYVNQTFIDISGYSELELIGHSHNIVRHRDMPTASFKELWNKLNAGQSWQVTNENLQAVHTVDSSVLELKVNANKAKSMRDTFG